MNLATARLALLAAVTAACAAAGCLDLFTTFLDYDDEGWLLLGNRLFLSGHRPYAELPLLYGPAWLAVVELAHRLVGVPVDHAAARYLTLVNWLLLSGIAALLARLLGASRGFPLLAFLLAFLFLRSIVNEPGHPQALVALLMLAPPLAVSALGQRHPQGAWALAGASTAIAFLIKPNAGAFQLAASVVVLAGGLAGAGRYRGLIRAALASGSLLAPFVLMAPMLSDPDCRAFAALSGLSAAAVAVIVTRPDSGSPGSPAPMIALCLGGALATVAVLAYAALRGIDAGDFASSVLGYAGNQVRFYHFFRHYTALQLALGGLSLSLAIAVATVRDTRARQTVVITAKAAFAGAALFALLIDGPANAQAMLGYAGPWCWLVAVGAGASSAAARALLAALGAWSPLIAYPIPGSQLYFGSLPILIAAIVCAADVCTPGVHGARCRLARWVPRLAVAAALAALGWRLDAAWERFARFAPLDLPGSGPLRLEPARAAAIRDLVDALAPADLVVTTFRFDSLHLWRGESRPSPMQFSQWPLAYSSPEFRERIRSALRESGNPRVVARRPVAAVAPAGTTLDWIDAGFETEREIGPYVVLRRRTAPVH